MVYFRVYPQKASLTLTQPHPPPLNREKLFHSKNRPTGSNSHYADECNFKLSSYIERK